MLTLLKRLIPRRQAIEEGFDIEFEPRPGMAIATSEAENTYEWPDDPDEVPAWVLRAEAIRASAGITARLPARTKREFWTAVELAEMTVASQIAPVVQIKPALPVSEAAKRFLAYIQHDEMVGEYTAPELSAHYSDFCANKGLTPSPVDHVKAELALLSGVIRQQVSRIDPITGRRHRNWMWIIKPLSEMEPETYTEEPLEDVDDLRWAA